MFFGGGTFYEPGHLKCQGRTHDTCLSRECIWSGSVDRGHCREATNMTRRRHARSKLNWNKAKIRLAAFNRFRNPNWLVEEDDLGLDDLSERTIFHLRNFNLDDAHCPRPNTYIMILLSCGDLLVFDNWMEEDDDFSYAELEGKEILCHFESEFISNFLKGSPSEAQKEAEGREILNQFNDNSFLFKYNNNIYWLLDGTNILSFSLLDQESHMTHFNADIYSGLPRCWAIDTENNIYDLIYNSAKFIPNTTAERLRDRLNIDFHNTERSIEIEFYTGFTPRPVEYDNIDLYEPPLTPNINPDWKTLMARYKYINYPYLDYDLGDDGEIRRQQANYIWHWDTQVMFDRFSDNGFIYLGPDDVDDDRLNELEAPDGTPIWYPLNYEQYKIFNDMMGDVLGLYKLPNFVDHTFSRNFEVGADGLPVPPPIYLRKVEAHRVVMIGYQEERQAALLDI